MDRIFSKSIYVECYKNFDSEILISIVLVISLQDFTILKSVGEIKKKITHDSLSTTFKQFKDFSLKIFLIFVFKKRYKNRENHKIQIY